MYTEQIFTETWFTGLLGFPGLPSAWTIARIVDISFDVMKHFIWEKLNNCTNIRINWEHYSMVEPLGTFKKLPGNLGSWFLVCNLILTQLERRPKKKMEDDLKKN